MVSSALKATKNSYKKNICLSIGSELTRHSRLLASGRDSALEPSASACDLATTVRRPQDRVLGSSHAL